MSSSAIPITPQRFAEALLDLPLPTLYLKAAEIRNSISHLESSNAQLQEFAADGDEDCGDAVNENKDTILRMEERVSLLRSEVERRGFRLRDEVITENHNGQGRSGRHIEDREEPEEDLGNQHIEDQGEPEDESENLESNNIHVVRRQRDISNSGPSMDDTELARRLEERIESDDERVDGVHL